MPEETPLRHIDRLRQRRCQRIAFSPLAAETATVCRSRSSDSGGGLKPHFARQELVV